MTVTSGKVDPRTLAREKTGKNGKSDRYDMIAGLHRYDMISRGRTIVKQSTI